jgi:osmotically-inducible protein OsmY
MTGIIVFIFNFTSYFSKKNTTMSKLNLILRLLICLVLVVSVAGCAGGKTSRSTGEYLDDSSITTKVKSSILATAKLETLDITVDTFRGVVQLSGFVDSEQDSNLAAEVARKVPGVKTVHNNLISR